MKKVVLKYGLISGVLISAMMMSTLPFEDKIGHSLLLGYTTMVLAFLLVYFGVRAYRIERGGHISFGRAFAVGISIMLVTCIFYVLTWEVMYFFFMPDFLDKYNAHAIEKARQAGASAAALQAQMEQLKKFKQLYDNPFINAAYTILEPLPVGVVIALISAAVLRRKKAVEQLA